MLVSCPIDVYSRVQVTVSLPPGTNARLATLSGQPGQQDHGTPGLPKARRAVWLSLARLGITDETVSLSINVSSPIPHGKGMGSSTADIAAAVAATFAAFGKRASPHDIAAIALSIEPTDGTMFRGIALFDHRQGRVTRHLGKPPGVDLLIVDPGGEVDTLEFNRNPHLPELNRKKEREVAEALCLVEQGVRNRDPRALGEGSTLSAKAHQAILPKPGLDLVLTAAKDTGGAGINVAHSGTVMGMLFDSRTVDLPEVETYVRRKLPWAAITSARLIGGGVKVVKTGEDHLSRREHTRCGAPVRAQA
ncbi:MAG: GHMP kinase [Firmicutes bacterium]|nr:GHMP kinase [Bacillota bacterium]